MRRNTHPNSRSRLGRSEEGAVLLEAAIVTLLLCVISFGIIEYGLLLRQSNQVADGVRSGVRVASTTANLTSADFDIVQAMKDSNVGLAGDIERLVIYKADANGNPVGACGNFVVVSGQCNVYTEAEFDRPKSFFEARAASQGGWSPGSRQPGVDYIGIRVDLNHNFLTTFFQSVVNVNDRAVVRLESPPLQSAEMAVDTGWGNGTNVKPPRPPRVEICDECGGEGDGDGPGGGDY